MEHLLVCRHILDYSHVSWRRGIFFDANHLHRGMLELKSLSKCNFLAPSQKSLVNPHSFVVTKNDLASNNIILYLAKMDRWHRLDAWHYNELIRIKLKLLSSIQDSPAIRKPKQAQDVNTHLLLLLSFLSKPKDAFMSSFRFLVRMSSVQYIPSGSHCTDKEAQLGHNDKILSFFLLSN